MTQEQPSHPSFFWWSRSAALITGLHSFMFHSNCSMVTWWGLSATRGHGWLVEDHTASEALITQTHQLTKHFPSSSSSHQHIILPDATQNLVYLIKAKIWIFLSYLCALYQSAYSWIPGLSISVERKAISANIQQNCTEEGTDCAYRIIQILTPLNFGLLLWIPVFICCNSAVLYATSDPAGKQMQLVQCTGQYWGNLREWLLLGSISANENHTQFP